MRRYGRNFLKQKRLFLPKRLFSTNLQNNIDHTSNSEDKIFSENQKQEIPKEIPKEFNYQENSNDSETQLKRDILESALNFVNEYGWTTSAISEACKEVSI